MGEGPASLSIVLRCMMSTCPSASIRWRSWSRWAAATDLPNMLGLPRGPRKVRGSPGGKHSSQRAESPILRPGLTFLQVAGGVRCDWRGSESPHTSHTWDKRARWFGMVWGRTASGQHKSGRQDQVLPQESMCREHRAQPLCPSSVGATTFGRSGSSC